MKVIRIRVWGDRALFSQPHFRTDPISYPCPTPSAIKGLLKSIFGKPEFEWEILTITILKPVVWHTQKDRGVLDSKNGAGLPGTGLFSTTLLCNVEYIVEARVVVNPLRTTESSHDYTQQALRRMRAGQQFRQPYFGHREFFAFYELLEDDAPIPTPAPINLDVGPMLFDLRPINHERDLWMPIFFPATIQDGVLVVPLELYDRERPYLHRAKARGRKTPRRSHPQGV